MSHVFQRRTQRGVELLCSICRVATVPQDDRQAQSFLVAHAHTEPSYFGAGDLVAAATQALGVAPCPPCEQRKRWLNARLPRVMRRR